MKLRDLLLAIKEENLSKDRLEAYRDELSNLVGQMFLEMAGIEKEQALFLDASEEKSAVAADRKWAVTVSGQRQIELKNYIRACAPILSSLKARLYNQY